MVSSAPRILADSVGPGGTAALVVLVLIVACVGIFLAFMGSQKRLRENVRKGTFNTQETRLPADESAPADDVKHPVSPDPGDRPAAGA